MKIKAIAITISDSRNKTDDFSGKVLVECLQTIDAEVIDRIIVSDDIDEIIQTLKNCAKKANLIITTGGTGFAQRDNTPEATRQVIEKEAQGLAELIRLKTSENTKFAWLSRGVCGIRGNCLIINFPGSPKAVKECFEVIKSLLPHAINLIQGKTQH
ncbi:MAG: MogA/MoaB family molybdenum cofactor biosynthesis protein [Pyrinomonadaceae bacterium]|nr:MogA/MoaB family molybdenum cofactor biosynthesis protein [Pyrinomonadaceae bacterium]